MSMNNEPHYYYTHCQLLSLITNYSLQLYHGSSFFRSLDYWMLFLSFGLCIYTIFVYCTFDTLYVSVLASYVWYIFSSAFHSNPYHHSGNYIVPGFFCIIISLECLFGGSTCWCILHMFFVIWTNTRICSYCWGSQILKLGTWFRGVKNFSKAITYWT